MHKGLRRARVLHTRNAGPYWSARMEILRAEIL
jgi:hypothetical protein